MCRVWLCWSYTLLLEPCKEYVGVMGSLILQVFDQFGIWQMQQISGTTGSAPANQIY